MDDLFFNDNPSSNDNRPPKKPSGGFFDEDEFDTSESRDVFSGSAFSESGFRVTLPDEEEDFLPQTNPERPNESEPNLIQPGGDRPNPRTPKGRPVSDGVPAYGAGDRTPKGKPVSAEKAAGERTEPAFRGQEAEKPQKPQGVPQKAGQPGARPPQNRTGLPAQKRNSRLRPQGAKKKKDENKGKKIAAAVIAAIFLVILSLTAYGYSVLGKINYEAGELEKNQYIAEKELASSGSVRNILLIGSDARSEIQGQRSDTMILFSIDKKHKKLKLTSFLRDSYVCIPSTGKYRKLNAACSSGGAQLVRDTIEYNFKVKIDDYVFVDFEAFTKLIDLMGGLTVKDVTASEAKYLRDKVKIVYAKEGTNKFSGAAALWYCRIRYLDNDFRRTERQRKVISAVISQAGKLGPVKMTGIIEQILPMISTNIKRGDMLSLGVSAAAKYIRYDIEQHQVPAKDTWSNKRVYGVGDVLEMDIDKNVKLLQDFIYKDSSAKEKE